MVEILYTPKAPNFSMWLLDSRNFFLTISLENMAINDAFKICSITNTLFLLRSNEDKNFADFLLYDGDDLMYQLGK